ncbi:response regulator [Tsuneonella amylolytica]|uniref:response regulator n=1 Tax=Tsuneonella amylolytica TaxID=2338327 RepID=UPI0013C46B51|nr:response regulator [Tsuneonella amylolytica]
MLADADELSAAATVDTLMGAGHAVARFANSAQTLEAIRFRQPHCVILDSHLPGGAMRTLRVIRQNYGSACLPVVMQAHPDATSACRTIRSEGVNAVLAKPASEDELIWQVSKLVVLARRTICSTPRPAAMPTLPIRAAGVARRFC